MTPEETKVRTPINKSPNQKVEIEGRLKTPNKTPSKTQNRKPATEETRLKTPSKSPNQNMTSEGTKLKTPTNKTPNGKLRNFNKKYNKPDSSHGEMNDSIENSKLKEYRLNDEGLPIDSPMPGSKPTTPVVNEKVLEEPRNVQMSQPVPNQLKCTCSKAAKINSSADTSNKPIGEVPKERVSGLSCLGVESKSKIEEPPINAAKPLVATEKPLENGENGTIPQNMDNVKVHEHVTFDANVKSKPIPRQEHQMNANGSYSHSHWRGRFNKGWRSPPNRGYRSHQPDYNYNYRRQQNVFASPTSQVYYFQYPNERPPFESRFYDNFPKRPNHFNHFNYGDRRQANYAHPRTLQPYYDTQFSPIQPVKNAINLQGGFYNKRVSEILDNQSRINSPQTPQSPKSPNSYRKLQYPNTLMYDKSRELDSPVDNWTDRLDETIAAIKERPDQIKVKVQLTRNAANKLREPSVYCLRFVLPDSTPMGVVKRLAVTKFLLARQMAIAKYSADEESNFYMGDDGMEKLSTPNSVMQILNCADANAFYIKSHNKNVPLCDTMSLHDVKYRVERSSLYAGTGMEYAPQGNIGNCPALHPVKHLEFYLH